MATRKSPSIKIKNPEVAAVFKAYPKDIRERLMFLRHLIFDTAAEIPGVGELEETLKWGEPSYLTPLTKSGSTVRINWKQSLGRQYGIYFKCTANLVPAFREEYPTIFTYGENRSIYFDIDDEIPVRKLKRCIALALTYHLNKQLDTSARWNMVKNIHD
ncbi:MAG: DUF1801 domain-containing protein [Spirochaetales bacterium]|jgi:hypothetical protein|nr:DUF1801 domain-containing protein [Spirochaetales bacterium]